MGGMAPLRTHSRPGGRRRSQAGGRDRGVRRGPVQRDASPVLKARLDHAFDLEEQGLAPLVITTGGRGGDPHFTEAGVGRDYLVQMGVAEAKVLAVNRGETTYSTVQAVAQLLRARHKNTCIAVSDGFHLYRVKLMFNDAGITAYGSPDPQSPIESATFDRVVHSWREVLLINLWYLGFKG